MSEIVKLNISLSNTSNLSSLSSKKEKEKEKEKEKATKSVAAIEALEKEVVEEIVRQIPDTFNKRVSEKIEKEKNKNTLSNAAPY